MYTSSTPVMTPGINFIFRTLTQLSLPPLALSLVARSLYFFYDCRFPPWILVSASLLSVPLVPVIRIYFKRLYDRRQAKKFGARLAPEVNGKFIGNLDVLMMMKESFETGYPGDGLTELHAAKGPVLNRRVMWEDLIFTTSPENIKRILLTDFDNYVKGGRFQDAMFSVLGSGVFNSDGDMWKFHRSMARPFFAHNRISDFDIFDAHSVTTISQIKEHLQTGFPIDFQDVMYRFTIDCASAFLFGTSLHSLTAGLPYPHNVSPPSLSPPSTSPSRAEKGDSFSRSLLLAEDTIFFRELFGWIWPLTEITHDKSKEPMKVVREYLDPIVKEAVEKRKMRETNECGDQAKSPTKLSEVEEGETFIDHLVRFTSDPVLIRDQVMNVLLAGRDTTAGTLTFIVYALAMYPHILSRLREEVLDKVGPARCPNGEDIKEMKYLGAVINETLRLFPVVPFNVRETINETIWPSDDPNQKPIYIPAGTKTAYSIILMHKRKDLWGPDGAVPFVCRRRVTSAETLVWVTTAEEFDPDRFLDERFKTYLAKNPFIFLPFNAGPRICLGRRFAYNEVSFMLIRLIQHFSSIELDLEACPPEWRPRPEWKDGVGRKTVEKVFLKVHLNMYSAGGLWVRMKEAEDAVTEE